MMLFQKVLVLVCTTLSLVLAKSKFPGLIVTGDPAAAVPPRLSFGANDADSLTATHDALRVSVAGGGNLAVGPETLETGAITATGDVSLTQLTASGVSQWRLVDLDTFDGPTNSNQWSVNAQSSCGNSADFFLGGHCKFAGQATSRTYHLPPHSKVKVTARVHYFDEWQGEGVSMSLDHQPTWAETHNWCPQFLKWMCKKYGVDSCGRDMPDRLSTLVQSTIAHTGPTLTVTFNSDLDKDADSCFVSWGVDDVAVYVAEDVHHLKTVMA